MTTNNTYYAELIRLEAENIVLRFEQTRLREALVQIQRLDFHGKLVPAAGWYVLGAELMPIVAAALSTPKQPSGICSAHQTPEPACAMCFPRQEPT